MATALNESIAHARASMNYDQTYLFLNQIGGKISEYLTGLSGWAIAATLLLILIAYDQCMFRFSPSACSILPDTDFTCSYVYQE